MKRKNSLTLLIITLLLVACATPESSQTDPQIVSMQQTLDAMQSKIATSTVEGQSANVPGQNHPTQRPPASRTPTPRPPTITPIPPTITLTHGQPSLKKPPTDTPVFVPIIPVFLTHAFDFDNLGRPIGDTCNTSRQDMTSFGSGLWRENDQLFGAGTYNCSLAFYITTEDTGTYKFSLYATYAPDFGELALFFENDTSANSVYYLDLFRPIVEPTGPIDLGVRQMVGNVPIKLIIIVSGKNIASSGYKFGIDYLSWVSQP